MSDSSLKFNVVWSIKVKSGYSARVIKNTDESNMNLYVKDDKGHRYDHFAGEGAAYQDTVFYDSVPEAGAFYFPALQSDAQRITFYDDDQQKTFGPITIKR